MSIVGPVITEAVEPGQRERRNTTVPRRFRPHPEPVEGEGDIRMLRQAQHES